MRLPRLIESYDGTLDATTYGHLCLQQALNTLAEFPPKVIEALEPLLVSTSALANVTESKHCEQFSLGYVLLSLPQRCRLPGRSVSQHLPASQRISGLMSPSSACGCLDASVWAFESDAETLRSGSMEAASRTAQMPCKCASHDRAIHPPLIDLKARLQWYRNR